MGSADRNSLLLATLAILLCAPIPPALAQDDGSGGGSSLDLGISGVGISFGNSPRWTGLRFNWSDRELNRIDGLNVTLWKPRDPVTGSVNGLAVGVLGPAADRLSGISFGLLGVLPERAATGITVGGLGVVSGGSVTGLNLGGLGIVTQGPARGVSVGGLGIVTQGGAAGLNVAGLGVVSEGALRGLNLAGLGVVAEGSVAGINLAGLGVVAERGLTGLTSALLGVVSNRDLNGITLTGLGAVANGDATGATIGGLGVVSNRAIRGLAAGLAKVDARDLRGLGIAGWTRIRGEQRGITIGVFNQAEELHGVQLGLLNFAGNNRGLARWLPILNLHFD